MRVRIVLGLALVLAWARPSFARACSFGDPPPRPMAWVLAAEHSRRDPVPSGAPLWLLFVETEDVAAELVTGPAPMFVEHRHAMLRVAQRGRALNGTVTAERLGDGSLLARVDLAENVHGLLDISLITHIDVHPAEGCPGPRELLGGEVWSLMRDARERCPMFAMEWEFARVLVSKTSAAAPRIRDAIWYAAKWDVFACRTDFGRLQLWFETPALFVEYWPASSDPDMDSPQAVFSAYLRTTAAGHVDLGWPIEGVYVRAVSATGERSEVWFFPLPENLPVNQEVSVQGHQRE